MIDLSNIIIDSQNILLKNINEKIELNKNEVQKLFVKENTKDILLNSNYNKNISFLNEFEKKFSNDYYNTIYMYYDSTLQYYKSCYYNSFKLPNTKNFIPKVEKEKYKSEEKNYNNKNNTNINFFFENNIKEMKANIDYKYSLNQSKNNKDLSQNFQILNKSINNINFNLNSIKTKLNNSYNFELNNHLTKINLNIIINENEIFSTSDKASPAFSEKMAKTTNYFSLYKAKNDANTNKDENLVEKFGKKGWICLLCKNFNYENRTKCNRCGIIKNPKNIIINKKDDWICSKCKNLNYSFRTICNRCKYKKINYYAISPINQIIFKNENIINNYNHYNHNIHTSYISPTFNIYNNFPSIL